ncbi:hypothetical protein ABT085_29895, partial [Streptomyces sp. NPDC002265]
MSDHAAFEAAGVADLPFNEPLGLGDPVFEPHEIELAAGSNLVLYGRSLLAAARHADRALQERLSALIAQSRLSPNDIG